MCARVAAIAIALFASAVTAYADALPRGFVYLRDVAPSILQDMRYATPHNFTGEPVPGYEAGECVLQRGAAKALKRAQDRANKRGYSLNVYDCYRPKRAVNAFMAWAASPDHGNAKAYYPHLSKSKLVPGYIASQSTHSAGVAVDLTLVPLQPPQPASDAKPEVADCTAVGEADGSLDMGTRFDCFDPKANTASSLASEEQRQSRQLLARILKPEGFENYAAEWWHFAYTKAKDKTRRDFPIRAEAR